MKVKELIQKLQNLNPDAEVLTHAGEGCDDYVINVEKVDNYNLPAGTANESFVREPGKEYIIIED